MLQGVNHFITEEYMVPMIPESWPAPLLLVYLSGVAEFVLGLAALFPRTQRLAGFGILALLVAVFPANINMALHPERWPTVPELALWARLPLQLAFAWWAYWSCISPRATITGSFPDQENKDEVS